MSPHIKDLHLKDRTRGFLTEFKTFIVKGNALDLAVGVVIGTAFNEVVNSLVKDIIMGVIATVAKQPDFSTWAYGSIRYGAFLNSLLNLVIVGFSVFIAIKVVNRMARRHKEENPQDAKNMNPSIAPAVEVKH
jgi:large conductance mechanosensitive channel